MSNNELRLLIKNQYLFKISENKKNPYILKQIYMSHQKIIDRFTLFLGDVVFQEKIYCYFNNINKNFLCPICKNKIKFKSYSNGYRMRCCVKIYTKKEMNEIKRRFFKKHNTKYVYDWSTFIGMDTIMIIYCPIHGKFEQKPRVHLVSGCNDCGNISTGNKNKKTIDDTKNSFYNTHGIFYTYDWTTYIDNSTPMRIICPIHEEFMQAPSNHASGQGCPECGKHIISEKQTLSAYHQKIQLSKIYKNNEYFYYWETYINNSTKMKIKCNRCELIFEQALNHHKDNIGCPRCNISAKSKGEIIITQFFEKNNIIFFKQEQFDNCKYKRNLKFDFYLPNHNICIEFDGIQHFKFIEFFHKTEDKFYECKEKDNIKNKYCKVNNIKLIRIPYWDENNIEKILINLNL